MARIQGYTEDDLDVLITEFEGVVEASLRRVAEGVASNLRPAIVAASSAGLGPVDVMIAEQLWQEEVDGVITPYIAQVYTGSAVQVAIGIGDSFPDDVLPGIPLVADEFAVTYMKTVQNRLSGVGDEVWEDIRNELLDGMHDGDSVEQIAARISNLANFEETRARRIARTEIHAASESGSLAQMEFMGYDKGTVTKEWVSTRDGRTRETHRFANGQTVEMTESFLVGLSHLQFPGDPTGAPGEIINCRCTTIFEVNEEPKFRCDGALVAATAGDSNFCVMPTPTADISGIAESLRAAIFTAFMAAKISPAWGGAKIFKVLQDVRQQVVVDHLTDFQLLQVIDHKYTGGAKGSFLGKFTEWVQTPAGQKATGGLQVPKPATHVVAPTNIQIPAPGPAVAPKPALTPPLDATGFPALPPVPPKPSVSDLTFTGKVFNTASKAQVWVDSNGQKWLFKPIAGQSYSAKFLTEIDIATSRLQSKALMQRPGIYSFTLDGKKGTLQSMFDSTDAFPGGSFDPLKLSAEDILVLQREQIFDWLISNHDTHSGQWIRTADGALIGIDKGQSFKFFPNDKLSWTYTPVTPLGVDKLTYSTMWKAFVDGKKIDLQDPTQGPLGDYIARLMAIPDDEYKDLLRPYFTSRVAKDGYGDVEQYLTMAVARKNALKTDFEKFYAKAVKARAAATPSPSPVKIAPKASPSAPVAPAPTLPTGAVTTGDLGDISGIDFGLKQKILAKWVELGNGKKVTPAWGGSKIWKLLQDLKTEPSGILPLSDISGLTHLQLLRILDEVGGFKGKPKTYEGVLVEWLESAAGKKAVPTVPHTLVKKAAPTAAKVATPTPSPPSAKVPSTIPSKFVGDEVTPGELSYWYMNETAPNSVGATWTYGGAQYRVILKMDSTGFTKAYIERYDPGISHWAEVKSVYNLTELYQYQLKAAAAASATPSVVPVTPIANAVKTVNGLSPGGDVTLSEIKLALQFPDWVDDDVLAIGTNFNSPGTEYRIIAKPTTPSGYVIQFKKSDKSYWENTAANLADAWVQVAKWKIPGSPGISPPAAKTLPTKIYGKAPGDDVTATELIQSKHLWEYDDVVAEADDAFTQAKWRVIIDEHGDFLIQFKAPTSTIWANTNHDLTSLPQNWKLTGDVLMGKKEKSLLPGKNFGDKLSPKDIWNLTWGVASPGDVIAYSWDDLTGTMYRIILNGDGDMEMQWQSPSGNWAPASIITDEQDLGVTAEWYAAHASYPSEIPDQLKVYVTPGTSPPTHVTKTTSMKKAPKKAKKAAAKAAPPSPPPPVKKVPLTGTATHFPGKIVGDLVPHDEILLHGSKYADGEIVATHEVKYYKGTDNERIIFVDGHLVLQKQTAAGAWKNEKIVTSSYQIYGQWKAGNGLAPKPQINSAKKFVAKQTGTASPPTKGVSHVAPTPSAASPPITADQLPTVDLSPWDATEQAEIADYMAGLNPSSDPTLIWGKLQQAKSHFAAKYKGKYLGLNEVEILRILDAANAAKKGKVDLHLIEVKIVNWLKSPAGKSYTQRRIDAPIAAPDIPVPMSAYTDYPTPPPVGASDYKVISVSEARQYDKESLAKYGGHSSTESSALTYYTGGAYTPINEAIRQGALGSYKARIYAAQRGMRPSTRPMMLHRGTTFLEFNDPAIVDYASLLPYVGRTYVNRGFNSTSVGGTAAFSSKSLIIEYEVPAGTPMAWVMDISQVPSEREMLLPTHMTYEILEVTKISSHQTKMRVRVLGPAIP